VLGEVERHGLHHADDPRLATFPVAGNQHSFSLSGTFPYFHAVYENGGMGAGGGAATYSRDVKLQSR
jgi:hypothetical protein